MKKLICSLLLICAMPFAFAESLSEVVSQVVKTEPTEAEAKEAIEQAIETMEKDPDFKKVMEATLEEHELTLEDFKNATPKELLEIEATFAKHFEKLMKEKKAVD